MKELTLDHHLETSALSGANIDDLFVTVTKHLYLENSNRLNAYQEEENYDMKSRSDNPNNPKFKNLQLEEIWNNSRIGGVASTHTLNNDR